MSELKRELQNRLYCIYRYSNKANSDNILSLNEKHGVPDIVDTLTMTFGEILVDIFKENCDAGIESGILKIQTPSFIRRLGNRFYKLPLFFNKLSIQLSYNLDSNKENFHFGYQPIDNIDASGKFNKVTIVGTMALLKTQTISESIERAMALFAHEMIHAYEDYNIQKNTKSSLKNNLEKRGYFRNAGRTEKGASFDKQRFSYIIYYLTPEEIRAYTTQIVKNIEPKIKYCSNSQEAFNLIKNTVTWKNFLTIESFLHNFARYEFNDSIEKDIEKWWYEITGRKNDYATIIISLLTRFEKAKKKIINTIGKRVYDEAIKNGLWGMTDDTDNLISI